MNKQYTMKLYAILLLTTLVLICFSPIINADYGEQTSSAPIGGMRGGFGVKAVIDNYQLAWGNRDVQWVLQLTGDFVLFGTNSGTVSAMSKGIARTPLIPPAFGFGAVTATLTVTADGEPVTTMSKSGFMIGPFVLLLF